MNDASLRSWRYVSCKQPHCLKRQFTVSCRALAQSLTLLSDSNKHSKGRRLFIGSPLYPRSPSTISPPHNFSFKPSLKIVISGNMPQANGPWVQTMSPVWMPTATLYLNPGPLDLWEYQVLEKGLGSWILKSVPSTVILQVFHWSLRSLLQKRI